MTTTRHCQPFSFLHNTFASAYQSVRGNKTGPQDSEALLTHETTPRTSTTNGSQNSGVSYVHDFVPLEIINTESSSSNSTKRQGGYYTSTLHAPEAAHLVSTKLVSAYQDLRNGKALFQSSEAFLVHEALSRRISTTNRAQNSDVSSVHNFVPLETLKTVSPSHNSNGTKRQGELYISAPKKDNLVPPQQIAREVYPESTYTAVANLVQTSPKKSVHFEMPTITVEAPSDTLESSNLSLLEVYLNSFPEDTSDRPSARMEITRADSDIGSVIGSASNSKIIEQFPETPANKPIPVSVQKLKPILKKPKSKAAKSKPAPIQIPQTGYYTTFHPSTKLSHYQDVSTQKRSFETTRIDVTAIAPHITKTPPRGTSLTWNARPSDAYPQRTLASGQPHTRSTMIHNWLDNASDHGTEQLRSLYQEGTGYPNIHISSPELSEFQDKYTKAKQQQIEKQKIDSRSSVIFQRLARMV